MGVLSYLYRLNRQNQEISKLAKHIHIGHFIHAITVIDPQAAACQAGVIHLAVTVPFMEIVLGVFSGVPWPASADSFTPPDNDAGHSNSRMHSHVELEIAYKTTVLGPRLTFCVLFIHLLIDSASAGNFEFTVHDSKR